MNVYEMGDTTVAMNAGYWVGVSNVDFGTNVQSISVRAASKSGTTTNNNNIYNAYSGNAQQFMLKSTSTNGVYVIATKCINTPMSYNSSIAKGNSIEFGIQGIGAIGSTINYTLS